MREAVNNAGGAEANDRESDHPQVPVSNVPVAACCLEAESTKAQSEVRSASRPRRQRGIRMAEKRGEAVGHDCIVLICIFGCGGHGQGTQEVVCVRAGAIAQQQPRGLRVLDAGDALEETVMFRALELPSPRRISVDIGCPGERQGKEAGREGTGSSEGEQGGPPKHVGRYACTLQGWGCRPGAGAGNEPEESNSLGAPPATGFYAEHDEAAAAGVAEFWISAFLCAASVAQGRQYACSHA